MARYLITELSRGVAPDGTPIVSAANLEERWQPQVAVDAATGYGLGWFVGEYKGPRLIHHSGNTLGFTADFAFLPDADLGIVVLANAQMSNRFVEGLRYRLFELVYGQPAETEEQLRFAEEQSAQAVAGTRAHLAKAGDPGQAAAPYLGRYAHPALGEITLAIEGGALILDAGEFRTELRPLKAAQPGSAGYLMGDPPLPGLPVELRRNGDGRPEVVITTLPETYVFTLVEPPAAVGAPMSMSIAPPVATPEP
jgi:hypothetical protein